MSDYTLTIKSDEKKGVLDDITDVITNHGANISYVHLFVEKNNVGSINLELEHVEDIDEFIKARDKDYQVVSKKDDEAFLRQSLSNFEVTQENVHLLIPSKLSWMANMLAEDKGISIVEAMKMLYSSEVYARLEKESTKAWHLGPVALYEEFQNN